MIVVKKAGFEDLLKDGGLYLKALILGVNGAGKTPFAAQWDRPIFALTENGHMSLARTATPYVDINSSTDMSALLAKLRIECKKPAAQREYATLVVDTWDSLQRKLIREKTRGQGRDSLSGWDEWQWLGGKMNSFMQELVDLPMNVVVLLHTKSVEEEVDGAIQISIMPRMKGEAKDNAFDDWPLIGLVEAEYAAGDGENKGKRVLKRHVRWQPDPKHPVLRDQSTKLPATTPVDFKPSDFQVIWDAITGGLDDLPATEEIETLETDEDTLPEDVGEVGALEKPALPKAKKAAAKKAPAKKAAAKPAPKASEEVAANEEGEASAPAASSEEPEKSDDPWQPPLAKDEEPEEPEESPSEPEPEEPKPAPKAAPANARICGTQPSTFAGKHPAVPGCGKAIESSDIRSKTSLIKFRTHLCGDCCELQTQA